MASNRPHRQFGLTDADYMDLLEDEAAAREQEIAVLLAAGTDPMAPHYKAWLDEIGRTLDGVGITASEGYSQGVALLANEAVHLRARNERARKAMEQAHEDLGNILYNIETGELREAELQTREVRDLLDRALRGEEEQRRG